MEYKDLNEGQKYIGKTIVYTGESEGLKGVRATIFEVEPFTDWVADSTGEIKEKEDILLKAKSGSLSWSLGQLVDEISNGEWKLVG